jgi:hypothetical protein
MESQNQNMLYLYDLPKDKVSSVKIAEVFKAHGINIGTKKPLIRRELFKPFYSAILHFQDAQEYAQAKEKMKYFDIDDCHARSLPFEQNARDKKGKETGLNVFFKLPKDADKNILTYAYLEDKFSKYG